MVSSFTPSEIEHCEGLSFQECDGMSKGAIILYFEGELDVLAVQKLSHLCFRFAILSQGRFCFGLSAFNLILLVAIFDAVINLGYEKCALILVLSKLHQNLLGRRRL
jgi:hypothetical protein